MTSIEEKSLKTQVKLLEEIKECDTMILYYTRWEVSKLLGELFKSSKNKEQEFIEVSSESYWELVSLLNNIEIGSKTFSNVNPSLGIRLREKEQKLEILNSLS